MSSETNENPGAAQAATNSSGAAQAATNSPGAAQSATDNPAAAQSATDLVGQLADQLDVHWNTQLRPRFEGLTDDEYFWCPVPNCWTVHPDGGIDFEYPAPEPSPFTTI